MTDSAAAPAPAGAPSPNDCLLTLSLPVALEEEVLDALLAHPELAVGFTLLQGYGMGTRVHLASAMEQVRGRARLSFVQIALPRLLDGMCDCRRKASNDTRKDYD